MTYQLKLDLFYYGALVVGLIFAAVAAAVAFGWLLEKTSERIDRRGDRRRERDLRWTLIDAARASRGMEDTCWYLLRGYDARLAETMHDARATVSLVADLRRARLVPVPDVAELA